MPLYNLKRVFIIQTSNEKSSVPTKSTHGGGLISFFKRNNSPVSIEQDKMDGILDITSVQLKLSQIEKVISSPKDMKLTDQETSNTCNV